MENIKEEIEDKIIDCINAGVAGRLIIFKPEANKFGADLAIERRGKYKEKEIYFQLNSVIGPAKEENFTKDFLQEGFKADKNFYLLFVYFDEIRQKINDYVWLVPSLQFRDSAETAEAGNGKKIFRFKATLDMTQKNQYSKFLIETGRLGMTILTALENKGKFEFRDDAGDKKVINIDSLKEFLAEARKNTYAGGTTPSDSPRLVGSAQLEFQKGDYFYRDIYFMRDKKFIGQEVIYFASKPIWGMNYFGDMIGKLETEFLKEALFKLADKCRMGQRCEHEKRESKYEDIGKGEVANFSGEEKISIAGKNIYSLTYQGGLL